MLSFPHLRYDPDLSFAFSTSLVFVVITGSVVLVSLNVDPVLYPLYPFILQLWITEIHNTPSAFNTSCLLLCDITSHVETDGPMSPRRIKP